MSDNDTPNRPYINLFRIPMANIKHMSHISLGSILPFKVSPWISPPSSNTCMEESKALLLHAPTVYKVYRRLDDPGVSSYKSRLLANTVVIATSHPASVLIYEKFFPFRWIQRRFIKYLQLPLFCLIFANTGTIKV